MDLNFWRKKRPELTCEWAWRGSIPGAGSNGLKCSGRVRVYDCQADDGALDKPRTLCDAHMREKNLDLDEGWTLVRHQD